MPPKRPRSHTTPYQARVAAAYAAAGVGPAPGGVSAPASAAAAAPSEAPLPPRIFGPRSAGTHRLSRTHPHDSQVLGNSSSLHFVSLMDAGIVADPSAVDHALSGRRRRGGSLSTASESMLAAYRRLLPYDGTKHSGSLVLHGYGMAGGKGLPAEHAAAYFGTDGDGPMSDALYDAAIQAAGGSFVPGVLRLDTHFETKKAHAERESAEIPTALVGGSAVAIPHLHPGERTHVSSPDTLRGAIRSYVKALRDFIDDMPTKASNRALASLVSSNVWLTPSLSARHGGVKKVVEHAGTLAPKYSAEGVAVMPASFLSSRAFVFDGDMAWPGMCIARSIVRGLDKFMDAQSDTHIVEILRRRVRGIECKTRALDRQLAASSDPTGAVFDRRVSEHEALSEELSVANETLRTATDSMRTANRTYKGDPRYIARLFSIQSRAKFIDSQLRDALSGLHPLVDFTHPRFRESQRIDDESVAAIRSALKPCVKVQFWTVGFAHRVVLAFPDNGATLSWLLESPHNRLINVVFAHRHVAWIRDVSSACQHLFTNDLGDTYVIGGSKIYCSLCGYSRSRTHANAECKLYEHQVEGCEKLGGATMTAALSPSNCRQLTYVGYKALNRPLLMATLTVKSFADATGMLKESEADLGVWGLLANGWHPFALWSDPRADPALLARTEANAREWEGVYDTYNHRHSVPAAEMPGIHFTTGSAPLPLHAHYSDGARPMLTLFCRLALPETVNRLWKALHYDGPRNEASQDVLDRHPGGRSAHVCFACQLPVNGPSTWTMQRRSTGRVRSSEGGVGPWVARKPGGVAVPVDEGEVDLLAECKAVDEEEAEEEEAEADVEHDAGPPVIHHCHATGAVAYAHNDCNTLMRQSSSTLIIDVGSSVAMAAAVEVLFSTAFYTLFLRGKPPTLMRGKDGSILSVTFVIRGSDRNLHPGEIAERRAAAFASGSQFDESAAASEKVHKNLRVTLRPTAAILPKSPDFDNCKAAFDAMQAFCESNYQLTKLWPGIFPTAISFSRNVLLHSLPPGEFATSISSRASFDNVQRMTRGGAIVIGEAAEMPALSEQQSVTDRRRVRLYFDITANYPSQLLPSAYPLPLKEHADKKIASFADDPSPAEAIKFVMERDLTLPLCERIEISGVWPVSTHARLAKFPPNFEPILVSPSDFSAWQQQATGMAETEPAFKVSAGHLRPVTQRVVFLRTARFWLQQGFQLTWAGGVWSTHASHWAAPFATTMQTRRRECEQQKQQALLDNRTVKAAEWATRSEDVKFISNAVIGALNTDAGSFTTLRTVPRAAILAAAAEAYEPDGGAGGAGSSSRRLVSSREHLASNAGFTGRVLQAGDCDLYEMRKTSWKHTQQTLAAFFIQEMARIDHLRMLYGEDRPLKEGGRVLGILDVFPNAIVGYGNTDSLVVELTDGDTHDDGSMPALDVRHVLYERLHGIFDISNVPEESSFFTTMPPALKELALSQRAVNAGRWGCIKEETGWAGVNGLVVIGPNRWGLSVLQHPTDTMAKQRDGGAHVLKSIPRAWQGAMTLSDFKADLDFKTRQFAQKATDEALGEPEAFSLPLPSRIARPLGAPLGDIAELEGSHRAVAQWGNRACRVVLQVGLPPRHFPFGFQEALKLHA